MTISPDITDTQALTALRHDLKEILRVNALNCDGATTDALLVRAAVDTMAALHTAQARSDEYLDDAQRAGARLAELEAEAVILRQYAITGATFAGMRDEIALPVGSWPHVGEFAALLAGAVVGRVVLAAHAAVHRDRTQPPIDESDPDRPSLAQVG